MGILDLAGKVSGQDQQGTGYGGKGQQRTEDDF